VGYRRKEKISNNNQANSHQYSDKPKIVGMSPYLTLFDGKKDKILVVIIYQ
jgi:hypothetical protein